MDFKRITSALLGFPLVVLVFVLGNIYVVDIALVIIAILSMYEYVHAVSKKSNPVKWLGYLSCLSICLIHILPIQYSEKMLIIAIPTVLLEHSCKIILDDFLPIPPSVHKSFIVLGTLPL